MAVTCADTTGIPVERSKCDDSDVDVTTWVVDGDAGGLSIASAPSGRHFDADPFEPGFTPLSLDGRPIQVRATPGSDLVLVTLSVDDASGGPALAWLKPSEKTQGFVPQRAPLPCVPIDMVVSPIVPSGGGEPVLSVVLSYNCSSLVGIAAFPLESRSQTTQPRTGERTWPLPSAPRAFSVGPDGTVAWVALAGATGDSIARIDLAKSVSDAGGLFVKAMDLPAEEDGVALPGCPTQGATQQGSLILGAPVATPDKKFVYVPLARPASVAVFDDALNRIDVNAPVVGMDGSGNLLYQHLGISDLLMSAPAKAIVMVTLGVDPDATAVPAEDRGVRAYVALENGVMTRVVVVPATTTNTDGLTILADPLNKIAHQIENAVDDAGKTMAVDSVALMPVFRTDSEVFSRSVVQNPEYPSFGSSEIISDATRSGKYVYYGVRLAGDVGLELSEGWAVTYEGVIPGATGCGLFEAEPDSGVAAFFRDPTADFCKAGVLESADARPGDLLVVVPDPRSTCAQAAAEALEFRIVGVWPDRLAIVPAFVSIPLPAADCFAELPLAYEIRASSSWTVVGTKSGFLHNRTSEGGSCVVRPDADARFNGRAFTTLPEDGGVELHSCPLRLGDVKIGANWAASRFSNMAFSFNVVPGCRTVNPSVIPPVRDTRLTVEVTSGRSPEFVILGGLPDELVVTKTKIYVLDVGIGVVYLVDASANTVSGSWY
jgi:hypothetical protein